MTDDALDQTATGVGATPDPFGGVPEASRGRRAAATLIDIVTAIGSPLLLLPPLWGILVVTAIWGIPLWLLSLIAAVLLLRARRQPNGDMLRSGQLVTGLTVMRTVDAHRVVAAADVEQSLRPKRSRVRAGRWAVALMLVAAVGIWGTAGWVYYLVSALGDPTAGQNAEWAAHEPEARVLVDAFITDLLSSDPRGGERYVAGAAKDSLPAYRDRIRREGVTAFQLEGNGQSPGMWEYMFREANPVQDGTAVQRSVSIVVEEVDGELKVTAIVPAEMYDASMAATETVSP
jgi:hypothetical protein